MKRTKRTAAGGLNLAQTRAIGRMTINFNWMEHGAEVLIRAIVSVSPEKISRIEQALKPPGFRRKLGILRRLVAELPDHYAKSAELDRAYAEFAAAIKSLRLAAKRLNEFRNNIVHWRPFLVIPDSEKQPKFTPATAVEIDAKSIEMDKMGTQFVERAVCLFKDDGSLTFGTHMSKRAPSSPKKQRLNRHDPGTRNKVRKFFTSAKRHLIPAGSSRQFRRLNPEFELQCPHPGEAKTR
jgi:hypothetical protein